MALYALKCTKVTFRADITTAPTDRLCTATTQYLLRILRQNNFIIVRAISKFLIILNNEK